MKNCVIFIVFYFACLVGLRAQQQYLFAGHITDTSTGLDAAFVNVKIQWYDSLTSNLMRRETVQTDSAGNYSYSYILTNGPALCYGDIEVTDCNGTVRARHFVYTNTNSILTNLDLGICVPTHICNASFSSNTHNGYPLVYFNDSSNSNTGFAVSWDWQFGDGTTGNDRYPIHEYPAVGTYYVCKTITTNLGCTSTFCDSVIAGIAYYNGCQVSISATNVSPGFYWFSANAIGSGGAITYRWEFPGWFAAIITPSDSIPFAFVDPGNYWVCGRAIFSNYCVAEHWINLTVPTGYCNATYIATADTTGQYTQILRTQITGHIVNYFWDFGDGNTSTVPFPTHTYAGPGTYNVCLTASDSGNTCTSTFCDSIVVINKLGAAFTIHVVSGTPTAASDPVEEIGSLKIYPNPANDILHVEAMLAKPGILGCDLMDFSGRILVSADEGLRSPGLQTMQLQVGEFAAGMYLLRLRAGTTTKVEKVLIAH